MNIRRRAAVGGTMYQRRHASKQPKHINGVWIRAGTGIFITTTRIHGGGSQVAKMR